MFHQRDTIAFFLLCMVVCLLFSGCGKKSPPPPAGKSGSQDISWDFQPKGIELHFRADPQLNLYNEKPHTLVLCVYQLTDPSVFNDLSKAESGIIKLLGCNRFDNSAASFQRIIVQPSEDKTVALDRAENAQFVGIVGGYYQLSPPNVAQLYTIPIVSTTKGLFFKKTTRSIGVLKVDLFLGPQEIQQLGSK